MEQRLADLFMVGLVYSEGLQRPFLELRLLLLGHVGILCCSWLPLTGAELRSEQEFRRPGTSQEFNVRRVVLPRAKRAWEFPSAAI
jgi:hypothetical protein